MYKILLVLIIAVMATVEARAAFPVRVGQVQALDTLGEPYTAQQMLKNSGAEQTGLYGVISLASALLAYSAAIYATPTPLGDGDPTAGYVLAACLAVIAVATGIAGLGRRLQGLAIAGLVLGGVIALLLLLALLALAMGGY